MPFDRNNPTHLSELQTEVNTDPIGMGYAAVIDQTNPLLKLLNDPDNNVQPTQLGENLTPRLLLDAVAVDPSNLNASGQFSDGDQVFVQSLMSQYLDDDIQQWRAAVVAILPNGDVKTALNAQQRDASRAEVRWGIDTLISRADWIAARDYMG